MTESQDRRGGYSLAAKQRAWAWVVVMMAIAFYVEPLLGWVLIALLVKAFVSWRGYHDPAMTMACLRCEGQFPKRDIDRHVCSGKHRSSQEATDAR